MYEAKIIKRLYPTLLNENYIHDNVDDEEIEKGTKIQGFQHFR